MALDDEEHGKAERRQKAPGDLRKEYIFDHSKAQPYRLAGRRSSRTVVLLDPDVAHVFKNSEAVNTALRAVLSAIPDIAKGS